MLLRRTDRCARRVCPSNQLRLQFEPLEERALLTITPVYSSAWATTLDSNSTIPSFSRDSTATRFDIATNQIAPVAANTPRFEGTASNTGKLWGSQSGLLLESGTTNLLTDSSFENFGGSGQWTTTGSVTKQTGVSVSVEGGSGLYVSGVATVAHAPVQVNIYPTFTTDTYLLSAYVRRADGGAITSNMVTATGQPASGPWDPNQVVQLVPTKLGNGPWYRVSARVGHNNNQSVLPPTTNQFIYQFNFNDGAAYYLDAAQLENAGGYPGARDVDFGTPTSYVPTTNAAASRAGETLSTPVQNVLPGNAWTYAFWNYVPIHGDLSPGEYDSFDVWGTVGNGSTLKLQSGRGYVEVPPDWAGAHEDPPPTGWSFVTVTFDGQYMDFFINGVSNHSRQGPFPEAITSPLSGTATWSLSWNPAGYPALTSPNGLLANFTSWGAALTPEEVAGLYATGTPQVLPPNPNDIPVTFTLSQAGKVSANLYYADGTLARQLVIGKQMSAGPQTIYWNGRDDAGNLISHGTTLTLKGLADNVYSSWNANIGNTSPDQTDEFDQYRSGWYYDLAPLPDGGVATLSWVSEHGNVVQALGGTTVNYKVAWNADNPYLGYGAAVAADSTYLYAVFTQYLNFDSVLKKYTTTRESISRWDLSTHQKVLFTGPNANGDGNLWVTPERPAVAWSDNYNPKTPYTATGVDGLAVYNGKLYVPSKTQNTILVLDAASGQQLQSVSFTAPKKIAVNSTGTFLYVTSGQTVQRVNLISGLLSGGWTTLISGLSQACAIAINPSNGNIYLTDLGTSQQVKVFTTAGTPVTTFGTLGGFQGGNVAPNLLEAPIGLAFGTDGTLFVADLGGRRVLALDSNFTVKKEIHGDMPGIVAVDPNNPTHVYTGSDFGNSFQEYTVNADGTNFMTRRWNTYQTNLLGWSFDVYYDQPEIRQWGARTFFVWPGTMAVAELVGDQLVPRELLGYSNYTVSNIPNVPTMVIDDTLNHNWSPTQLLGKGWVWRDGSAGGPYDGQMQASEFTSNPAWTIAASQTTFHMSNFMDPQGNIYRTDASSPTGSGLPVGVLKHTFGGLDGNGIPVYSWDTTSFVLDLTTLQLPGIEYPIPQMYAAQPSATVVDPQGNFYVGISGNIFNENKNSPRTLLKYDSTGKLLWHAGRHQPGSVWHPGDMTAITQVAGFLDNQYIFTVDYLGQMNIWDTDGLYLGRLFDNLLDSGYFAPAETFGGTVYRVGSTVYAISASDAIPHAVRVIVNGLDNVQRFSSSLLVDVAPTVSLTTPSNNVVFVAPDASTNVLLSATAADADSTVTAVAFYQGTTKIADGILNAGVWTATWNVQAWSYGEYSITAKATDNFGLVSVSSTLALTLAGSPTNQAADIGQTATITVASPVGASPLASYQWQKFTAGVWTNISGATSAYYTTPAVVQADDGSQYRLIVSKTGGTAVTSPAATLSVNYGLEAWWKFDETSGSSPADSSGKGHTGAGANGGTWTTGILNSGTSSSFGAAGVDGIDSYVSASAPSGSPFVYSGGEMTLSTWVYVNSAETSGADLISKPWNTYGGQYDYRLRLESGRTVTVYLQGSNATPFSVASNGAILPTGTWSHVAATFDSAKNVKLYLNGALVGSGNYNGSITSWTPSGGNSNKPLVLGSKYNNAAGSFGADTLDGRLDNTRIYTHALSALAIAEQARAPVAYWKFNETSGTASDSSGNGYTGTLTSSPSAQFTSGYFNNGVSFNGTTGHVTAGASVAALKYKGTDLTLSSWVFINSTENTAGTLVSKPWTTSTVNYALGYTSTAAGANTALTFNLQGGTSYTLTTATNVLAKGAWHHVAVTVSGATKQVLLYLDGVQVASGTHAIATWAPSDTSQPLVLGSKFAASTSTAEGLNGKLDNARVFDRALSATDIRFLAIDPPIPTAAPLRRESQQKSIGDVSRASVDAALAAFGFDWYSRAWDDEPGRGIQTRGAKRPIGLR